MESIESTIHKKPNVVIETYESYLKLKSELKKLNNIIEDTSNYVNDSINYNINELVKLDCLEKIDEEYKITLFGELSAKIKEGPGILICYELYWNANILNFSLGEIVGFLSIFTPIKVNEDCKLQTPNIDNDRLNDFIVNVKNMYYSKYENLYPNEFQYDIIQETMDWVNAETEIECKQILYTLENEKQVFLGEFVKALLKINHISLELETVANLLGNVQLANIFNTIPKKTLKYVATNQSLYV